MKIAWQAKRLLFKIIFSSDFVCFFQPPLLSLLVAAHKLCLGAATRRNQRIFSHLGKLTIHPTRRVNSERRKADNLCLKNLKYKIVGMSKNTQNTRTFLKEKIIQKCSKIFLIKFVSTILLFLVKLPYKISLSMKFS